MTKTLLSLFILVFSFCRVSAQPYAIYHERSGIATGCGNAHFVSSLFPTPTDNVTISFTAAVALQVDEARIYYTTDGSNPSGSLGVGTASTQVITCAINCNASGATTITGIIPHQQGGVIVKYIISGWDRGNMVEVFGNSSLCSGCTPITTSTNATTFSYAVQGVLPISFVNITAAEGKSIIRVYWASAQESNMAYYEIYRSRNSLHFEKIGIRTAIGNSPDRTDYYFDDQQPIVGNNYYRVVAVDLQGKTAATKIIRVLFGKNDNSVVIFPNPSASILNVRVADLVRGDYVIKVFDNGGRLLFNNRVTHNGADGVYPIHLPNPLAKGNYRLVLTNKYQFYTASFIIR